MSEISAATYVILVSIEFALTKSPVKSEIATDFFYPEAPLCSSASIMMFRLVLPSEKLKDYNAHSFVTSLERTTR